LSYARNQVFPAIAVISRNRYSGTRTITIFKEKPVRTLFKLAIASTAMLTAATFANIPVAPPKPVMPTAAAPTPASFSPEQTTAIQKIVHDYLVANPEVLIEASKTLQQQQEQKMQAAAMGGIAANKAKLFDDAKTPSIGNKNGDASVVEFFDYQCGHCREMAATVEQLVAQNKNLHVIFKELPIFGGASNYAARAALAVAATQPDKYYAFHNALLTSEGPINPQTVTATAKKVHVDVAKMQSAMNSPDIQAQLKANFELAQSLKIMGTPTFVLSNKAETKFGFIPGATSLEDLEKQINGLK